jgi:hypothetical protein
MAVDHRIVVRLTNQRGNGGGGTRTRTSAVGSVRNAAERSSGLSGRDIARGLRSVRTLDAGSFGLFGSSPTLSITAAIVQESIKLANKVHDIYLNYELARTGESMSIGNIRRIKGYILNPTSYMLDATWGVYLQKLAIARENTANAYYRELSGNLIVGNQYRGQK